MTTLWVTIFAVALASATIKAAGPALVGGRELPPRAVAIIAYLAPALRSWSWRPSGRTGTSCSMRGL